MSDAYYRLVLMVGVLAVLIWSAIGPHDRVTWWLETAPVWAGLAVLILTHQRFPLTRLAYTLIAVHMLILCVGGHYTYALVPAGDWVRDMVDGTRNNYDKLGHFWQGFCPAIVARELIVRTSPLRSGGWLYFLVLCFALALSAVYELIEWAVALLSDEAADAFLGTQGYVWDTQSDMWWCGIGALVALTVLGRAHDRQLLQHTLLLVGTVFLTACTSLSTSDSGWDHIQVDPRTTTLAAALEQTARTRRPTVIELLPGDHLLRDSVVIGAHHPPLQLRGHGDTTRLTGSIRLDHLQWTPLHGQVQQVQVPAELLQGWHGGLSGPVHTGHGVEVQAIHSELVLGTQALRLAMWPNSGFTPMDELLDAGSAPRLAEPDIPLSERKQEPPRGGVFRVKDTGQATRWSHETNLWAHGYWNWDWSDEQLPVQAVHADGRVVLDMPHRYGLAARGSWRMVGALCDLDAPGEFWLDAQTNRVCAWLPETEAQASRRLTLLAAPLLRVDRARDLHIEGISFEASRGAGIVGADVERVSVDHCTFRLLGTRGVALHGQSIAVRSSLFEDLGGAGVELDGGDRLHLTAANHLVEDCVFRRTARVLRTYQPAVRLAGVGTRVVHNEFSELPHFALMAAGNDHLIEANSFHHVVQETGDAGAIYFGRDWTTHGNIIRGNLFHDIQGNDARFQNAVYLDDMASGVLVERNVHVRCNWGALIGGGRDNTLRDNLYIECVQAIIYDARGVGWMAGAIADASTSTILQRYAAMPIQSQIWSARFPSLLDYLSDRRGRPVGGRIEGTLLVSSTLGRVEDPGCVTVSGTQTLAHDALGLQGGSPAWLESLRQKTLSVAGSSYGPVGPRTASRAGR